MSAAPIFGIRVARARVVGFRMLAEVDVSLEPGTTVILGENNTGKSAFLAALGVALGGARPSLEDLHRSAGTTSPRLQIDIRFEPTSGTRFDGEAINALGDAIELGEAGGNDSFSIRVEGSRDGATTDLKVRSSFLRGWGTSATERDQPPVSNDVRKRLSFDLLDAQRDVVAQLRNRRTTWSDVATLSDVGEADRKELEGELRALSDRVTEKSALLSRVRNDLSELGTALGSGPMIVGIDTLPRRIDDLVRSMDITVAATGADAFGAAAQGMGTRSLAALLVFRSAVNGAQMPTGVTSKGAARLSAFEEPEAHLHPHAQRSVFNTISAVGGQKIVTTHSTQLVSSAPTTTFRSFRRVGAAVQTSSTAGYPKDDLRDVERLFLHRHPEAMFAKAVGLVEGDSERLLVGCLAKTWWVGGEEAAGVSIVNCDGVNNVVFFAPLLARLGIPWTFLRDGDMEGDRAEAALTKRLRLVLQIPEDKAPPLDVVCFAGVLEDALLTLEPTVVDQVLEKHDLGPLSKHIEVAHGTERVKTSAEKLALPNNNQRVFRDFKSDGGIERGRRDLLLRDKAQTARLFGSFLAALPPAAWPLKLREFFQRIDILAGRDPRAS